MLFRSNILSHELSTKVISYFENKKSFLLSKNSNTLKSINSIEIYEVKQHSELEQLLNNYNNFFENDKLISFLNSSCVTFILFSFLEPNNPYL